MLHTPIQSNSIRKQTRSSAVFVAEYSALATITYIQIGMTTETYTKTETDAKALHSIRIV